MMSDMHDFKLFSKGNYSFLKFSVVMPFERPKMWIVFVSRISLQRESLQLKIHATSMKTSSNRIQQAKRTHTHKVYRRWMNERRTVRSFIQLQLLTLLVPDKKQQRTFWLEKRGMSISRCNARDTTQVKISSETIFENRLLIMNTSYSTWTQHFMRLNIQVLYIIWCIAHRWDVPNSIRSIF